MGKEAWKRMGRAVSETVFPSNIYCICCGSLIDGTRNYSICDECMKKLHWINGRTCEKCGKALPDTYRGDVCYDCMIYPHSFTKGYSCLTYGMKEREIILDMKYGGRSYLAEKFADMLFDRITCEDIEIDGIVSVPVSRGRLRKRGYDQAELMAKGLAARWDVPLLKGVLRRDRETPLLRGYTPAERESILRGAFSVTEAGKTRMSGKRILLIDDIYTTGSTADACSDALISAGAAEVRLLTLASGGNRKPNTV